MKKTESSSFELFSKGPPFVLAGKYKIALSYFEEAVKKTRTLHMHIFKLGSAMVNLAAIQKLLKPTSRQFALSSMMQGNKNA